MGVQGISNSQYICISLVILIRRQEFIIPEDFETEHGKGEHDGVGAFVKWTLKKYKMINDTVWFESSTEVVN